MRTAPQQTHDADEGAHELDDPDGLRGVDDADVDEHVRQVVEDDGAQEPQAQPRPVQVH